VSAPLDLDGIFRAERPAVLAVIARRLDGDLALAEDVVQEALLAATVEWGRRGLPDAPGAWLTTVAWNRALDRLRRERTARIHAPSLLPPRESYELETTFERPAVEDDQLAMLFACCHPALAARTRLALTLRSVAGLTVAEIARLLLVSEAALERSLVRARRKIRDARIPFRVPPDELLPERLAGVLRVVYLLFTAGHDSARDASGIRADACEEAIRLARLVARLMPDMAEAHGLLALLLLTDARRPARLDADGELVSLERQDRGRWDAEQIAAGDAALATALRLRPHGAYTVQAAIAATHARAARFEQTDWGEIAALYGRLHELEPTPVVALNRAVAIGMADGPGAGLALLDELAADARLDGFAALHAARAELLLRAGEREAAATAAAAAIAASGSEAERRALARRFDA